MSDPFGEWPLRGTIIEHEGDIDDTSLLYDFDPWMALRQVNAWRKKWQSTIDEWRENTLRLEAISRGESPCSVCPHNENGCKRAGCLFAKIWTWKQSLDKLSREILKHCQECDKPIDCHFCFIHQIENIIRGVKPDA